MDHKIRDRRKPLKQFCIALFLVIFLNACGSSGLSGATYNTNHALIPQQTDRARAETESDAASQPTPMYTPSTADLLYVSNAGNNSVTVYHHDQQGNSSPIATISGSKTMLAVPGQLSEDALGNLYVANTSNINPAILTFAHGANGNVAPIRVLSGPLTQIVRSVYGLTVDTTTGKIFVETGVPQPAEFQDNAVLLRFPPSASGNTAPFAAEPAPIGADVEPSQLAQDSTGKNVLASGIGEIGSSAAGAGLYTLYKQFPSTSPNEPIAANLDVAGIADDPSTKSYLFSGSYESCAGTSSVVNNAGIARFSETANGSADYLGYVPCEFTIQPAPISIITSDTCGTKLALGYLRNIYVVHSKANQCPADAVYVYTHDASGSAAPLRVLSGLATKLNQPNGIYEGQ